MGAVGTALRPQHTAQPDVSCWADGLMSVLWSNVVFTNVLFLLNHIQCSFTPNHDFRCSVPKNCCLF